MIVDETIEEIESPKKKKRPKIKYSIPNSVLKLMNHIRIESEDCIVTKDGVTDYLILENYAIKKETEENQRAALKGLVSLFRAITSDIKLIFMSYSVDTKKQIDYIYERSSRLETEYLVEQRDHKVWELNEAHNKILQNVVYVQIFGKDKEELDRARNEVLSVNNTFIHVNELPLSQKKAIIYQLNNLGERPPEFNDTVSLKENINKNGEDRAFMSEMMPESGVTFKDDLFVKTGNGYIGCYHLFRYSKKERFYWGEAIFRQPGTITTIDITHLEAAKVKKQITKNIGDKEDNAKKGNNREIKMNSAIEKNLLEGLLEDMLTSNESVKEVTIRYYIAGATKKEVKEKAKKIDSKISFKGYKARFFLGEEKYEWQALFSSQTAQKERKKRTGKELTTTDLGTSYPLNHSQLIDPRGVYFGISTTGGLVIFDPFHKDKKRLSYNFILLGVPGSGKSSTFKKLGSTNHLLGNYTYYFVVSKEYDTFMERYDGLMVDASGSNGTSNPFQVYATVIDEDTNTVDEDNSYSVNLNKLKIIFTNMYGEDNADLKNGLNKYLDAFYKSFFKKNNLLFSKITQYEPEQYPLLEDFQEYIDTLLYDQSNNVRTTLSTFEADRLDKISTTIDGMIQHHAPIFNRHTTIDLDTYRSVAFNLDKLLNLGRSVFNAQLYNLLFLVWNLSMQRGMREKYLVETGQKEESEAIRTMILLDEFHNITRQENMDAIDLLDRYDREARKAYGGLGIATHDISDVLSDSASGEFKDKVKKLFKLSTYKFIMAQDADSKKNLKDAFDSTLKESELDQIPLLELGEVILCIAGKGNISMKIDLSPEEKRVFTGGH